MACSDRSPIHFAWLTLMLACGCATRPQADYRSLGLVEVAGVITLDDQPVPQAAIFFHQHGGSYSYGITDDSGRYVAMFNSEKSGVLPGPKLVEISTVHSPVPGGLANGVGDEESDQGAQELAREQWAKQSKKRERIPACYNTHGKLKVNIERSDRSFDFQLKSDCSTSSAS